MQLARKIVLTLGIWAVLIIAGLETIGVLRELRATEADMQHDHRLLGETLGAAVARAWVLEGSAAALDLLKGVNRSQQEVQVRFVWVDAALPDGPLVLFSKEDREQLIHDHWLTVELERPGPNLRVSYTPVFVDGRVGALEISQSLALQQALVTRTAVSALIAFALLGALYLLMSVLLGDRLVGRPIEKLVAFSRRLGEGDLSARVELDDTRDELSTLGRALGDMATDLGRAKQRADAELTKRLEIAEHLRHADRLATVGKLAAGVAHELGTPLNVVGARAKMIATEEVDPDETKESARIIGQQVNAMTTIIQQLLDFARRRQLRRSREDVAHLVGQVTQMLGPLAAKKGITLDTSAVTPLETELDSAQIHQVLTNLVMNAIQATNQPATIRIATSRVTERPPTDLQAEPRPFVRIDVADEGAGISAEVMPHLFEPFFTTKDVGEGTGLGLAVSWGIVQDHGGFIQVQSAVQKGSTFSVFLPDGGF